MKLSKDQMLKTAKRILKPEFHEGMKLGVRKGIDDNGYEFSFPAVIYNDGKNFIGEEILRMNCID